MGIFRRRLSAVRPPEFDFFDDQAWRAFNGAVRLALRDLRLDVERAEPGVVILRDGARLGLLNAAQLCFAEPVEQWRRLIADHFQVVIDPSVHDAFEPALLRVRLVPAADTTEGSRTLRGHFAPGIVALLVADLPTVIRTVSSRELEEVGLTAPDAWDLAWTQTRRCTPIDEQRVEELGGAELQVLSGASFFVASTVPYLPDQLGDIGDDGALVTVPSRHLLVAHPVRDSTVVAAVQTMLVSARRSFEVGPGSISPELYWWRNGVLTLLPSRLEGGGLVFEPPDDFVSVVERLVSEDGLR